MMDVFLRALDIHTMTTCIVFGEPYDFWQDLITRSELPPDHVAYPEQWQLMLLSEFKKQKRLPCKTVGFGVLYGQTSSGMQSSVLAQGGPLLSLMQCDEFIAGFFDAYPNLRWLINLWHRMARETGMVWDMFGRWRVIPEVRSSMEWVVTGALRQAGNTPIQSGAGGVLKLCMAAFTDVVNRFRGYATEVCDPLLTIHDELIFEVSPAIEDDFIAMGKRIMTGTVQLTVPIRSSSDVAERWGDLK
jgi:DNA polymerase-1